VRSPAWVRDPLHAPPPLVVTWEPAAEAAARSFVLFGHSRFYRGRDAAEADALVRAITQVAGLDTRSVSHGRGTKATGHTTQIAVAQQRAAAALAAAAAAVPAASVPAASSSTEAAADAASAATDSGGGEIAGAAALATTAASADLPPPLPAYELRFERLLLHLRYRRPLGSTPGRGEGGEEKEDGEPLRVQPVGTPLLLPPPLLECVIESCTTTVDEGGAQGGSAKARRTSAGSASAVTGVTGVASSGCP
jgi:hypothetical protein